MSSPTDPANDDFETRLRQILREEADGVTPSPEALNLIRERTSARRGGAWFGLSWLRPALAVAGAVLIAASVVMSTPRVREQVLEMVPAGADRQTTPAEQDGGGVAAPAPGLEEPAPEPETFAPEPSPEPSSEPSEPAQDGPDEEGPALTSACRSASPSASPDDEESDTARERQEKREKEKEKDCAPSEEPEPGDGAEDPGDDTGGGEEPGGDGGGGSGSGDDPATGGETEQKSSTSPSSSSAE